MDLIVIYTMSAYNNKLWYILIILTTVVEIAQSNENDITTESRRARVSGRIVKLYSGIRNDPILCPKEGFLADPVDCSVFYRCLKATNGKYTVFRFQCGPGTVYDPETEVCNHPHSTKRSECGGLTLLVENNKENEIEGFNFQSELPSPITTKLPDVLAHPVTINTVSTTFFNKNEITTKGFEIFNEYSTVTPAQTNGLQNENSPQFSYNSMATSQNILSLGEIHTNSQTSEVCTAEGFIGDTNDCKKFYRCVSNQHGGFIRYEFMCSNLTIWDDDTQGCNHVWAARNRRCGKDSVNELTQVNPFNQYEDINRSENTQMKLNTTNDNFESQKQTSFGQNQNLVEYGDKIYDHDKKPTVQENRNPIKTTTQISYTESPIHHESNEKYTHQQNTLGQIENVSIITTSTTLVYGDENDKERHDCKSSGFMGDASDCTKFYRCVYNGRGTFAKFEFTCSSGTVWDQKLEACNYDWAVKNCGNRDNKNDIASTISSTLDRTSSAPSIITIKETPGYENLENVVVNSTKSSTSSNSWIYTTTSFVQTTTQNNKLDDDYDFGYTNHAPIANRLSTIRSLNSNNLCTFSGFFGDINDCKKFYRCVDNNIGGFNQYEYYCGEGTVWDSSIEACNHAWAVKNCGNNKNEQVTTPQTSLTSSSKNDNDYSQNNLEIVSTSTSQYSTTKGTDENKCLSSGFMGDIKDCKKFYRCVDDGNGEYTQYQFICGDGTVWDPKIEACNHKNAVERMCGVESDEKATTHPSTNFIASVHQTENSSPSEAITQKTSTVIFSDDVDKCKTDGFMGDSKNCRKFYRCVSDDKGNYIRYEFLCGEGTAWDQQIQGCNHEPEDGLCKTNTDILKTTQSYKEEHSNNDGQLQQTTVSLGYFPDSSSELSQSQTPVNICTKEGFFPDDENCQKFYRCVDSGKGNYIKYEFTCGEGTVWDQEIISCNHNSNGKDCKFMNNSANSHEVSTNSYLTSSLAPVTQIEHSPEQQTHQPINENHCTSNGFYANLNDCKKFYRCVDDGQGGYTKYDFTCAEGTIWIQSNQICDRSTTSSNCTIVTSSSNSESLIEQNNQPSTTIKITERPNTTPERENDEEVSNECTVEGFFPNKNDCRQFYRCVYNDDGKYTKYEFSCGEGTAWDVDIRSCNHISEVKSCHDNIIPSQDTQVDPEVENEQESPQSSISASTNKISSTTSTTPLTTSIDNNNDFCSDEGFFGNSKDCRKFYRCVSNENDGFTKYDFICGDGTIWDQDILACNHPQDVVNPSCNSTNDDTSIDNGSATTLSHSSSATTSKSSTTPLLQSSTTSEDTSSTTDRTTSTTERTSTTSKHTSTSASSQSNAPNEDSNNKPDNHEYKCTKAGFFADPNDCKKFYRCVDWDGEGQKFSIYHFECGEGTIWDPALDTCNHENSVYPPRDCSTSQNYENSSQASSTTTEVIQTTESTSDTTPQPTTDSTTTSTEKTTTKKSTTQMSTTKKTTPSSTTTQTTSTQSSTLQSTTEQTTTQASSTLQQTSTTEQSFTSEKSTTSSEYETTTSQQTSTTTDMSEMTTSTQSPQTTTEQTTDQSSQATKDETSSATETTTKQMSSTEEEVTENQSSTTTVTESSQESTTQTTSTEKECPKTNDDEYLYVCPTSFRRHPKYCNKFYQCTEEDDTHDLKIATFQCPNNTIYDESKTKCVEEKKAQEKCNGEIAQNRRVKRLDGSFKEPIILSEEKLACPSTGHFILEKNEECSSAFLRCKSTKKDTVQGFIYRCPEGYVYWTISRKCEAMSKVKDCRRSQINWSDRHEIPIELFNVAYTKVQ